MIACGEYRFIPIRWLNEETGHTHSYGNVVPLIEAANVVKQFTKNGNSIYPELGQHPTAFVKVELDTAREIVWIRVQPNNWN